MKYQGIPNLTLPVIAAPMFLISDPGLVIACCNNGIIGSFPSLNQRTADLFESWIVEIKSGLSHEAAPYAVNLIVHKTNFRVFEDLKIIIKHKVPIVITSLGANKEVVEAVHSYGGMVFHDVIKKRHAEKAAEAGVDGLILVCAGAGGHGGTLHPIAFINDVRSFYKGKIILSGSLSTGEDVASTLSMGADFAYMGTRFINTKESKAPQNYKDMIINGGTNDIVYTSAVSGIKANFLKASLEKAGITEEMWSRKGQIDFSEEIGEETKAWKNIWSAGQGVSAIDNVLPIAKLVQEMKTSFSKSIQKQQKFLDIF